MQNQTRLLHLSAGLFCLFLFLSALFFQYALNLEPCPLCVLSRLVVIGLGIIHLAAFILNPQRRWLKQCYSLLGLSTAIIGLGITIRHVWIQHLPADQVPACGPSLDYLLDTLPLTEVLQTVLSGDGECAKVDWTMLGFSMPSWLLLAFAGLVLLNAFSVYKNNKG